MANLYREINLCVDARELCILVFYTAGPTVWHFFVVASYSAEGVGGWRGDIAIDISIRIDIDIVIDIRKSKHQQANASNDKQQHAKASKTKRKQAKAMNSKQEQGKLAKACRSK